MLEVAASNQVRARIESFPKDEEEKAWAVAENSCNESVVTM